MPLLSLNLILLCTDFEEAEKAFDDLREMDPFRLDEIEIYSNMLYVMNKKAKLAQIAHEYAQIDKNRAEVCCLIGKLRLSPKEAGAQLIGQNVHHRKLFLLKRRAHESDSIFQAVITTE